MHTHTLNTVQDFTVYMTERQSVCLKMSELLLQQLAPTLRLPIVEVDSSIQELKQMRESFLHMDRQLLMTIKSLSLKECFETMNDEEVSILDIALSTLYEQPCDLYPDMRDTFISLFSSYEIEATDFLRRDNTSRDGPNSRQLPEGLKATARQLISMLPMYELFSSRHFSSGEREEALTVAAGLFEMYERGPVFEMPKFSEYLESLDYYLTNASERRRRTWTTSFIIDCKRMACEYKLLSFLEREDGCLTDAEHDLLETTGSFIMNKNIVERGILAEKLEREYGPSNMEYLFDDPSEDMPFKSDEEFSE